MPHADLFSLAGKRALVTGASRGIGRSIAVGLAAHGADVVCVARSREGLEATAELGPASMKVHSADLRAEDSIREAIEACVEMMGGLDILVNNAADDHDSDVESTDLETWQRVVELNLQSCYLLCRHASPHLREGGGKVVNVGSILSTVGFRNNTAYIAAKSGLLGFTRALALEWARRNVQVNMLAPGFVRTEMTAGAWSDEHASAGIVRRTPMGRWGEPADLVGPAVFLAGPASDFMTGQIITVDGGWTAQ